MIRDGLLTRPNVGAAFIKSPCDEMARVRIIQERERSLTTIYTESRSYCKCAYILCYLPQVDFSATPMTVTWTARGQKSIVLRQDRWRNHRASRDTMIFFGKLVS